MGHLFCWFAQHERALTGASPQAALTVGRLQPKARVSIVGWNLKEAVGKHLPPTYRNLIPRLMRVDKSAKQDKVLFILVFF